MGFSTHLYLRTMSVVLKTTNKVIQALTDGNQVPKPIEHDRGINLLFKLFLPFLDDYLYEESNYAENITKKYIDDWVRKKVPKKQRKRADSLNYI